MKLLRYFAKKCLHPSNLIWSSVVFISMLQGEIFGNLIHIWDMIQVILIRYLPTGHPGKAHCWTTANWLKLACVFREALRILRPYKTRVNSSQAFSFFMKLTLVLNFEQIMHCFNIELSESISEIGIIATLHKVYLIFFPFVL